MGDSFSGSEIVEIGIQIEINGRDFYKKMAEKTKNQSVRDIFQALSEEEEEHITTFQKILNSVHEYEPRGAYPDEYFAYMNALAGGHVFTKEHTASSIAENTAKDIDAVDIGIIFEEESITFYEEMKMIVPANDQELLVQLIEQEKKHLQKLIAFKNKL
ncbi:MAG: ferritin family protein [Candidatus Omnitrophica bacterium]|nr:ferritin family protein [Candidatus Omnitrophota bacterium]